MADIVLHTGSDAGDTRISNNFIDNYMREANGEYVKIYLYLLRHLSGDSTNLSIEGMADALDHTQLDIRRALRYWQDQGLLRLEYDDNSELRGICLIEPKGTVTSYTNTSRITPMPQSPEYSPEALHSFSEDQSIRELLFVAEQYLGRTLGASDMNMVIYWYDGLHMSIDLIEYLIESCVERGHANLRYMNKVAMNWLEEGIYTVDEAKSQMASHRDAGRAVMKSFGITGRVLTPNEQHYIKKWEQDYSFSVPIIEEALNRTIATISKPSFEYADSILARWAKEAVKSLEDIKRLDALHESKKKSSQAVTKDKPIPYTDRFHNSPEREYDMNSLERKLLLSQS